MIAIVPITFIVLFILLNTEILSFLFSWNECNKSQNGKHCIHYHNKIWRICCHCDEER